MNGITEKTLKVITDKADSIGQFDRNGIEEKVLRDMIYKLGCYVYRQHQGVGYAVDNRHPSVNAPKRVWSQERFQFLPESAARSDAPEMAELVTA